MKLVVARQRQQHDLPSMTPEEVAQLTEMFAGELRRGWIPHLADLEDALGLLRNRATERSEAPGKERPAG